MKITCSKCGDEIEERLWFGLFLKYIYPGRDKVVCDRC